MSSMAARPARRARSLVVRQRNNTRAHRCSRRHPSRWGQHGQRATRGSSCPPRAAPRPARTCSRVQGLGKQKLVPQRCVLSTSEALATYKLCRGGSLLAADDGRVLAAEAVVADGAPLAVPRHLCERQSARVRGCVCVCVRERECVRGCVRESQMVPHSPCRDTCHHPVLEAHRLLYHSA